jgi:hypothetical protein
MIAYDVLVNAIHQWRIRQGLPVGGTVDLGSAPTRAASTTVPPAPRRVPPSMPPPPADLDSEPELTQAVDNVDVVEERVNEEAMLDNEGTDFAMQFGQPTDQHARVSNDELDSDNAPSDEFESAFSTLSGPSTGRKQ